MRIFGLSPTLVDYNTLMASLCKESSLEQARRLFQETRNSSCKPDIISFNIMTDGILKAGDIQSSKEDVRTMDTTYLHIGMILSTLGLSPHGFALGLYPKGLIPMEIFVHPYIPMILPISSQCGTLVVYPTEDASTLYLFLIYKRAVKTWTNGTGRRCF